MCFICSIYYSSNLKKVLPFWVRIKHMLIYLWAEIDHESLKLPDALPENWWKEKPITEDVLSNARFTKVDEKLEGIAYAAMKKNGGTFVITLLKSDPEHTLLTETTKLWCALSDTDRNRYARTDKKKNSDEEVFEQLSVALVAIKAELTDNTPGKTDDGKSESEADEDSDEE